MAVITLPSLHAASMSLQLVRADQAIKMFGGSEVILASVEALWVISMQLPPMRAAEGGREWFAAMVQMSNLENTAKIAAQGLIVGSGYAGANPTVDGAGQLGLTLNVTGATPSTTIGLAGDPFEVNGEYKILTSDATTDGSGDCSLEFEPALRQSPSNGATVNVKTPQITVRNANPLADLQAFLTGHYGMVLNFVETYRT